MKRLPILLVLGVVYPAFAADEPAPTKATISVPGGATLEVTAPDGWTLRTFQPDPTLPPTIRLRAPEKKATLQVSFFVDTVGELATKDKVEDRAAARARWQYLIGSTDKKVTLQTIESSGELCVYAELSGDRMEGKQAKLGSDNVVATGLIKFGRTIGVVNLLGSSFDDPAFLAGKEFLKSGLTEKKPAANAQP